ncbi:quinolinate synthase NadA, partial [Enterobacter hormaechei]|uniref:quinolinate synthase NadA n=2 Tax=Pseudomonadota TaxID=1224 RepID=UPI0013D57EE0
ADELLAYRIADPDIQIIAHPECPPEVVAIADYTGSTSGMINYVKDRKPAKVLLVTECSMASNIESEVPGVK